MQAGVCGKKLKTLKSDKLSGFKKVTYKRIVQTREKHAFILHLVENIFI